MRWKTSTLAIFFVWLSQGFFCCGAGAEENSLVEVQKLDPGIRLDVRYAASDNFMGEALYPEES